MKLEEKTKQENLIYDGRIIKVFNDDITLPNDKPANREVVRHNGGCCVLALNNFNEILLVKQFRYPYKEVILEIPAGKLNKGENIEECAIRELKEETGAIANNITFLGEIYPTPGYCDEKIYIYYTDNIKMDNMNLDDDEFLNCEAVSFDKALDMVMNGEIKDAKTIIAILKVNKLRQSD